MYTASLNSIRFRYLIITFTCLPLVALLLSSVLSRSGLTQAGESGAQTKPPALVAGELIARPDLPPMTNNAQLAASELLSDTTDLCAEVSRIPTSAICTHRPDKPAPGIDRQQPTRPVADQGHSTAATVP